MSLYQPSKGRHDPRFRPFVCQDCDMAPDAPMVNDEVWEATGAAADWLLCIACTEKRLGRQLTVHDLRECVGNAYTFLLFDRLAARRTFNPGDRFLLDTGVEVYIDKIIIGPGDKVYIDVAPSSERGKAPRLTRFEKRQFLSKATPL